MEIGNRLFHAWRMIDEDHARSSSQGLGKKAGKSTQ